MASPLLVWPRWTEYRFSDEPDGWIYAAGDARPDVTITADMDLASRFAKLVEHSGLEDRIDALRQFYREYGLLGRQVGPEQGLDRGTWHVARFGERCEVRAGDPWKWALDHATNVWRILRVISKEEWPSLRRSFAAPRQRSATRIVRQKRRSDRSILTGERKYLRVPIRGRGPIEEMKVVRVRVPLTAPPWRHDVTVDMDRRHLLAALLNQNLATVAREFDPETGVSLFRFRALLEVIYWQLADRASDEGRDVRRCQDPTCGALFFARDPRQRFCPPPPSVTESRCGRRVRKRRPKTGAIRRQS